VAEARGANTRGRCGRAAGSYGEGVVGGFRRISLTVALSAAVVSGSATLVSCGGAESEKTFAGEGYAFTYPGGWEQVQSKIGVRQGSSSSSVTLAPGNGSDGLLVEVYRVPDPVTKRNIKRVSATVAEQAEQGFEDGRVVAGPTVGTVADRPAFRLELSFTDGSQPLHSQMIFLFEGTTEYFLNCQFTQERAEEMKRVCEQVVNSFQLD
jgi:hypothetical protein